MFAYNNMNRKIQEHNDLGKMLKDAMERANCAESDKEYWDAWAEVQLLQEEIKDTEQDIGGESVGIWS